ncbi:hypothetical protein V500_04590 [Pseudogymnoascus sp. VKM F-4518 (FW-2643)]|nr:hypothetical protein V500_04590 [Pseudogymnoascus sp. VKM F-4518 (FW-2643)]
MATLTETRSTIAPYDSNVYNTVNHTLRAAVQKAQERNIQAPISTSICDCFIKHHIEKDFSASLIHRHYDLVTDEQNVESDGKFVASKDLDGIYHPAGCSIKADATLMSIRSQAV